MCRKKLVQGKSQMYFTKLELGSPPREFEVLFDTGSDLSWVACSFCADCPRSSGLRIPINFYDITSSQTAELVSCSHHKCNGLGATCSKTNQCNYHVKYGDGDEVDGYYVSDVIHFDMLTSQFNSSEFIVFGCTENMSGLLTTNNLAFSGIVGFGPGQLSVLSQLSSRASTPKVFSHCLRGDRGAGGVLALGEVIEPRIIYTPLIGSRHYNVELESISVDGKVLPVDRKTFRDVLVDSGTTLAYLPEVALTAFITAVNIAIPKSVTTGIGAGRQIYEVPSFISMANAFPPVSLNFPGGVSMLLQEYLLNTSFFFKFYLPTPANGVTTWEIAFQKSQGPVTIFGDIILKDKIIEYDLARQRLGWPTRDCTLYISISFYSEYMIESSLSSSSIPLVSSSLRFL
ncbi:hypothetical protein D8674_035584 [Pyrus ussuriensis x Pyrus communis]|uniref:Peptidase A1 domain-containing protein n=1 Tax=Pyrus ussuriensis x Pyrus communis TaxID=2448454 RepID=A0A5N5GD87_9ROSA|nr:hypothetical protein D8674_035584 [Pyrus ussuriensis x Pyrus communis]